MDSKIFRLFSDTKVVLIFSVLFVFSALIVNGSLFDFFKAKKVNQRISENIQRIEVKSLAVKSKLEHVNDPEVIEKKIRESFDYAEKGDLIFIFEDENSKAKL